MPKSGGVTLEQAKKLAQEEVEQGRAIRWRVFDGELCIESDQGWQTIWPLEAIEESP